jgi:small ligand-binding sensory domain FIST
VAEDGVVPIAVGLSTQPDARVAAAEAAMVAREPLLTDAPTLAVIITSPHHAAQAHAILDVVQGVANPDGLIGCVAEGVVANGREVEDEPAVAVWLAALPQPAETFHMEFVRTRTGGIFAGYRFDRDSTDLHLLLPNPHTFPTYLLFDHLNTHAPGTTVMGGLVGAAPAGRTTLFYDGKVVESGAVGARVPGLRAHPVVSQGCRPIGDPYTVTGAEGQLITELAGQPPLRLLEEMVARLRAREQLLVSQGLLLGIAIDEYKAEFGRGDFLIRALIGADEETGALEVGDVVEVGTTVQFHVRDAATADEDLRESLLSVRGRHQPAGALLFPCNGRGSQMFDAPNHDAAVADELLGGVPIAGFFAAGELGPIGGKNFLHGFTASLAIFLDVEG